METTISAVPIAISTIGQILRRRDSTGSEALFQLDAPGCPLSQPFLHRPAAMHRRPVPDHQQPALYLFQQLLQKADYVRPLVRVVLRRKVEFSSHADSADDAQVLAAQLAADYRGPAHRRPSAQQGRKQVKARFVGPQSLPPSPIGGWFCLQLRPFFQFREAPVSPVTNGLLVPLGGAQGWLLPAETAFLEQASPPGWGDRRHRIPAGLLGQSAP